MADETTKNSPIESEAMEYLTNHRIMDLFNNMTSELVYSTPDNPKEYLVGFLERLKKAQTTRMDYPCIFEEGNIDAIFGMLDPTGNGFITLNQYKAALESIGVKEYDQHPAGADINKITIEVFSREAKLGLSETSSTFLKS